MQYIKGNNTLQFVNMRLKYRWTIFVHPNPHLGIYFQSKPRFHGWPQSPAPHLDAVLINVLKEYGGISSISISFNISLACLPRERRRANSRFFKSLKANTSSFVCTNQLINRLNSLLSYHILKGLFRRKEKQNKVIPFGSHNGLLGFVSRKQIGNIVTVRRTPKFVCTVQRRIKWSNNESVMK